MSVVVSAAPLAIIPIPPLDIEARAPLAVRIELSPPSQMISHDLPQSDPSSREPELSESIPVILNERCRWGCY